MIYGAGIFFAAIHKYFDLDGLNIIGVADRRFEEHTENEQFLGYKVYSPNEIRDVNPDYVLVATKFFIDIIEDLDETVLKNSKIKIKYFKLSDEKNIQYLLRLHKFDARVHVEDALSRNKKKRKMQRFSRASSFL